MHDNLWHAHTLTHTRATEHRDVKVKSGGKVNELSTNADCHHRVAAWGKNRGLIILPIKVTPPPIPLPPHPTLSSLPPSLHHSCSSRRRPGGGGEALYFPSLLSHLFQFVTLCPLQTLPPTPAAPSAHPPPIPSHPPRV